MEIVKYSFLVLAVIMLAYGIIVYNRLVMLKHNTKKAWGNIDVLLKQRHDELPKLVAVCKEYMQYEQATLERVTRARSQVAAAREAGDIEALGAAESKLRSGLGQLFALVENYPDLKANEHFQHLQNRITATAAQGYVELVGRSELHPGSLPLGYLSGPPCVWYQYAEHDRHRGLTERGCSNETFLLADESGTCVIDPEGAEVITSHKRAWQQGDHRYEIEFLAPGDTLYALGELATLGIPSALLDKRNEVSSLLNEWKQDRASLLARFDSNGDGQIDLTEWERVREAAQREIDKLHHEIQPPAGIHLLQAPKDGRPFLLANRDPACLARHLLWWSWLHLAVFAMSAIAALAIWQ